MTSDRPIFMRPGHCAGDLLQARDWEVLSARHGAVVFDALIPEQVLNPRGQLFGGFTGTYVDLVALYTVRTTFDRGEDHWMTTVNMRIDYLEPVPGPRVRLKGELLRQGRSTSLVAVHFMDDEDNLMVYALVTIRAMDRR